MRVEVRCCCDPGLLLGYVLLDRDSIREGDVLSLLLRPVLSLRPFWEQKDGDLFIAIPAETLRLPVALARGMDKRTGEWFAGLAIKSNDTPIETLRRIHNFTEVR
jgi:hypothetical protein